MKESSSLGGWHGGAWMSKRLEQGGPVAAPALEVAGHAEVGGVRPGASPARPDPEGEADGACMAEVSRELWADGICAWDGVF
jgi:hypothetical protein